MTNPKIDVLSIQSAKKAASKFHHQQAVFGSPSVPN
jgi:hypothetical protein